MDLQTPLARVRGLGSARDGTQQYIIQRLTAIALVPLLIWFIISIVPLAGAPHAEIVAWMRTPFNTEWLILLILVVFYHLHIGLFEILEDYMHSDLPKTATMVLMKFFIIALTVAALLAVLRVTLGG